MMYVEIDIEQLGRSETALVLYSEQGVLHGASLLRGSDGQIVRSEGRSPVDGGFMMVIWEIIEASSDDRFRVIFDAGGYWPEAFPKLNRVVIPSKPRPGVANAG